MIWNILCLLLGVLIASLSIYKLLSGTMAIYIPDEPDEMPYLTAELDKSLHDISKRKYILLKVDVRNLNSHQ